MIVYGSLRSGTTMLRLMLDGHPELTCSGESDFLFDHLRSDPSGCSYDINGLKADWLYQTSAVTWPEGLDGTAALFDMVDQLSDGQGRSVLMLHRRMDLVAKHFPGIPVIHLNRDPRDVARSSIGMGWAGNVYHGCDHWVESQSAWDRFQAANHSNPVLELSYEDLVADPIAELTRLCQFVSLDYDPAMLSYPAHSTYDPPDAALAFQWKQKLSTREIGLIETRLGPMLAAAGYEPSGVPAVAVKGILALKLAVQNRIAIWQRMVSQFGLTAPAARSIGRRFGLSRVERYGTVKIGEMQTKYVK
ncbi:sulfotransferase family protein [Aestuariivita sp.]|uniref:sulfotransferase family protein n=1 Tax=Aestuariivita sp. TaxID=1872407 RepID=UPI003BAEEA55